MAQEVQSRSQAMLEHEEPERSPSGMAALERHILLLVLVLHLFDRSTAGVLVSVPQMALLLLAYNGEAGQALLAVDCMPKGSWQPEYPRFHPLQTPFVPGRGGLCQKVRA